MSTYGNIRKEDLFSHLCQKKVFPGPEYYNEVKVGILEFLGPEFVDEKHVPKHILDRVSLEAFSFSKLACKNWPKARGQKNFLLKFTKPGCFLNNYIRVPGPYKRNVVVPSKKKSPKKPRKRKPFPQKGDRAQRNDSKLVREAAFGDVDTVLYTATNMAKGDLGYVLKKWLKIVM